jgi:hypothetical protein
LLVQTDGNPYYQLHDTLFQRLLTSNTNPHSILTRHFQPSNVPYLPDFAVDIDAVQLPWYIEGKKDHSIYAVSLQTIITFGYLTPTVHNESPICVGCKRRNCLTPPYLQYCANMPPNYLCFHRNIESSDYFYGTETDPNLLADTTKQCIKQMPVILLEEKVQFTQWPLDTYILKCCVIASHVLDEAGSMPNDYDGYDDEHGLILENAATYVSVTKDDFTGMWLTDSEQSVQDSEQSVQVVEFTDISFLRRVRWLYYERQAQQPATF